MKISIKAVIFDLDGVLVDMCENHRLALNMALQEICQFEIALDEHIETFNGLPTKKKLQILASQKRVSKKDFKRIEQLKQDKTIELIHSNLCVDAEKTFMHFKLGLLKIQLACVTNSIRLTAIMALNQTGQLKYLQELITAQDVEEPKPSPEGYLLAMKKMNVKPTECLVVEDSPKGIEAGKKSGARVHIVSGPSEVNWFNIRNVLELI